MTHQAITGAAGVAAFLAAAGVLSTGVALAQNDGLFDGTYVVAPWGDTVHVTSACPRCDAVGVGPSASAVMHWTGAGWERTHEIAGCGTATGTGTPTVVADGYVQELTLVSVGTCPAANTTAVWTRVGP